MFRKTNSFRFLIQKDLGMERTCTCVHGERDNFINNMLKVFTKMKIKVVDFNI